MAINRRNTVKLSFNSFPPLVLTRSGSRGLPDLRDSQALPPPGYLEYTASDLVCQGRQIDKKTDLLVTPKKRQEFVISNEVRNLAGLQ